jgi:hypothetical protein
MLECLTSTNAAQRNYLVRMLWSAGFSIVFSLIAKFAIRLGHLPQGAVYPIAILPAFPIMGALVATGLYLAEEKDEFQRQVLIEAVLGGMGITLAGTTVWGYLQDLAHAPQLDSIWVYPIFWIATGVCSPFVKRRYR